MTRALLVGEWSPLPAAEWLTPWKPGSGKRLAALLGLGPAEFEEVFARTNLWVEDPRDRAEGKGRARDVLALARRLGVPVVALGRKVSDALPWVGQPPPPFGVGTLDDGGGPRVTCCRLPHPSGRCRTWNDPGAAEKARRAVEEVCGSFWAVQAPGGRRTRSSCA